jgi:RNA polymerase sigma factor (sigma-70 family)
VNAIDSELTAESLLHRFVKNDRAEESFRHIVEQQSSLVLSTATRQLAGDRALAEDVSQEVFKLLARKAARLDGRVSVAGWLYRQACRQAVDRLRSESRRHRREEHAQDLMNSKNDPPDPALIAEIDEALLSLPEPSRDAVIMRYLEGRTHKSVGQHLGMSEDAVRKRISRALESLKSSLGARGIKTSTSLLATSLATMGTESAKASTVAKMATFALQSTSIKTGGLSFSAVAAGFLATSAVAVGLRVVADTSDENLNSHHIPVADSKRTLNSHSSRNTLIPPNRNADSFEDIIAALKELSRRPQHEITRYYFKNLLDQISDDEIPEFVEVSKSALSRVERGQAYFFLFNRWSQSDPKSALDFAFYEDVSTLLGKGSPLVNGLVDTWAEEHPEEAMNWLLDEWSHPNWEAVWGMNRMGFWNLRVGSMPNIQTVADKVIFHLKGQESIAEILEKIESLPSEGRFSMLRSLSIGPPAQESARLEISRLIHDLDHSPESQLLRHFFWAKKATYKYFKPVKIDQAVADKILTDLGPDARYKARLAMINLPQDGESLSKVFEAGKALQIGKDQIVKDTAESYLAAPFVTQAHDLDLSKWINENAAHHDLDDAIRHRIERGDDRTSGDIDENKEANAMLLSLSLSNQEEAHRQARHHFENLLSETPTEVPYFLRIFPLPEELHQEFLARFQEMSPNSND